MCDISVDLAVCRVITLMSRDNETCINSSSSNVVGDSDVRARGLFIGADAYQSSLVHFLIQGLERCSFHRSSNEVVIESQVVNCIYGNSYWSEREEDVVTHLDVLSIQDSHTPSKSIMECTVCHSLGLSESLFKSDGRSHGINLRAVVHFDVIHEKLTSSCVKFTSCHVKLCDV